MIDNTSNLTDQSIVYKLDKGAYISKTPKFSPLAIFECGKANWPADFFFAQSENDAEMAAVGFRDHDIVKNIKPTDCQLADSTH